MSHNSEIISVFVKDFCLDALVGIYDIDQTRPTPLRVSVVVQLNKDHLGRDDIAETISYDLLIEQIRKQAQIHVHLLEKFAEDLADYCFQNPLTQAVEINIEKHKLYHDSIVGVMLKRHKH
jgi:dihydroneopterin aldolase